MKTWASTRELAKTIRLDKRFYRDEQAPMNPAKTLFKDNPPLRLHARSCGEGVSKSVMTLSGEFGMIGEQ